MRAIRLTMGVVAIVFAILRQDMLLGAAGGFLLLTALLNAGCCGVNGCAVPTRNQKLPKKKQNNYEVIQKQGLLC